MTPLGVDLRRLRFERGKHLKDVARDVGITESYLSYIEKGERVPRGPIALRIAAYYGLTIAAIWPPAEGSVEEAA